MSLAMSQSAWIIIAVAFAPASIEIWRFRAFNVLIFPLMAAAIISYDDLANGGLELMCGLVVLVAPYLLGLAFVLRERGWAGGKDIVV